MKKTIIFADGNVFNCHYLEFPFRTQSGGVSMIAVDLTLPKEQIEFYLETIGIPQEKFIVLEPMILHEQ